MPIPLLGFLGSFFGSTFGQIVLVAIASFAFGHHHASTACRQRADIERAQWLKAQTAEIARQANAAQEIALHDRARADEAAARAEEMQRIIDDIEHQKGDPRETERPTQRIASCPSFDERAFAERVRRLDAAAAGRKH